MRMFLDASLHGKRNLIMERQAACQAIEFLNQVARSRNQLSSPASSIDQEPGLPIPKEMWKASRMILSSDLTPMAAVAGSIAEATSDYLMSLGATRAIVNNGGDIAIRTLENEPIVIGIRSDVNSRTVDYKLPLYGFDGIGGVCTSGLGGRSLTRGIASAVVVLAEKCPIADAAATEIANHTCISSLKITKTLAKYIDPESDIANLAVTVGYDKLDVCEITEALSNGLARARQMLDSGLISGVFIKVCDQFGTQGHIMNRLQPLG